MRGTFLSASLVLAVVFGLSVVPGLALAGQGSAGPAAAGGTAPSGLLQQDNETTGQECNYEELYDRNIDSVVLVRTGQGLGSGFVFSASVDNGSTFVVTNQHVVNGSEQVLVKFNRGESALGTVVGTDVLSDLAVIRVQKAPGYVDGLPLADGRPQPGERVAAFGSPFGLESTITSGIISGTNRSIPTGRLFAIPNTIQTDAPINPGNSGGPLVLCGSGEVVGVNRAGGAENIGFAIPASIVKRVVPALITEGDYDHPFLGVQVAEVTPPVAEANELNTTQGVLVTRTIRGTPAAEALRPSDEFASVAGMRVPVGGDVIVEIGNRSVETPGDLARFLALQGSPGETVELTVLRDGERRTVNVTLAERPEPEDV